MKYYVHTRDGKPPRIWNADPGEGKRSVFVLEKPNMEATFLGLSLENGDVVPWHEVTLLEEVTSDQYYPQRIPMAESKYQPQVRIPVATPKMDRT